MPKPTNHEIILKNAVDMEDIPSESIDLVVTSPPYPMIKMWDEVFGLQNHSIKTALSNIEGEKAFELMHQCLDPVWDQTYRVLKDGGFACINIGDATRTVNNIFGLFSNHSRILQYLTKIGFRAMPEILWRKQTNAPNKFMGSGMLPAGAYVTLEHEYILIVRKGDKRVFRRPDEKSNRRESAYFWEERNIWFSDVWMDIKGARQALYDRNSRFRSAAFPFELAYRLVNMFSVKNDVVLDPFMGTGTTAAASIASGRNSIGYEIDVSLKDTFLGLKDIIIDFSNRYIENRIIRHLEFVRTRTKTHGVLKYINLHHNFPVMTRQEVEVCIDFIKDVRLGEKNFLYASYVQAGKGKTLDISDRDLGESGLSVQNPKKKVRKKPRPLPSEEKEESTQLQLFPES